MHVLLFYMRHVAPIRERVLHLLRTCEAYFYFVVLNPRNSCSPLKIYLSWWTGREWVAGKDQEAYVWYPTVRCAGNEGETKSSRLGLIGSVRAGRSSGRSQESCERAITARPTFQALPCDGGVVPTTGRLNSTAVALIIHRIIEVTQLQAVLLLVVCRLSSVATCPRICSFLC